MSNTKTLLATLGFSSNSYEAQLINAFVRDPVKFDELFSKPDDDTWRDLWRDGRKIDAIKAYRSMYGASLKDAKDACEDWAAWAL